jgi:hypothetical protein
MKLSAVILSLTILIQSFNFSFSDILQLNELIEHAQFHKEKYGDDFLTFLSKHYGEDKIEHEKDHQEELPEHEKLPFNHQHIHSIDCNSFVLNNLDFSFEKVDFKEDKITNFYYLDIYSSIYKEGILQPPIRA